MNGLPTTLPPSFTLRARRLFPGPGPPASNPFITVRNGRIASLAAADAVAPVVDLEDAAILPGLVNAHTHLEFSDLAAPLGRPGLPLPDWIRLVIRHRRRRTEDAAAAIAKGIEESLAAGVTTIGEIATGKWSLPSTTTDARVTAFHESIGLAPERIDGCLAEARNFLAGEPSNPRCLVGLSPHAPYTVHPDLCAQLVELAKTRGAPVAMHLAESREERELLRDGRGALVELLEEMGAWRPSAIPRGARPLDYLRILSAAPRALVIHGNYFDDEELRFLAEHRDRMSLVYCPRTHDYFRHAPYHDIELLVRRGVQVCVGTDSRASNPDLSLFAELQFMARRFPSLSGETILGLGTSAAAIALGRERDSGRIAVGTPADLCIVATKDRTLSDPYASLWEPSTTVAATIVAGKLRHVAPAPLDRAT